ncbi:MAG TPA: ATP-dependent helicase HrpB [Dissulfurispiraceae bacterium]|nr:ATP-dependent helicase HrpB [Dissulfurispiraceae bacterium]
MIRQSYPIDEALPSLTDAVLRSANVVLQASPGAGKTTLVPLALLDVISPEQGRIVMLEPRRIAAASAARRMAQLLGEAVGETVGYAIRFDRKVSERTRIEVVTEGILTRRIQSDPLLEGVAMVIFDEFHERSIHADLALALCLDVQRSLREDLNLLVMSATLDSGPIATLLGGVPVITFQGNAFPVEERYLPPPSGTYPAAQAVDAAMRAVGETEGDLLVFLPGSGEIRRVAERLAPFCSGKDIDIHPLYGDMPFAEQERAIMPSQKRKVVLATNIAETSLTIEGVRVVIDCGLTRRLQYDPATGMNRLITVCASRASAEQRKGRAGRLDTGICYRLYSQHTLTGMMPFALPEIATADLAPLVLELAVWGIKDPLQLRWLDLPQQAAWESARQLLFDLDALDSAGYATKTGKAMAGLPLHPRLARLLMYAVEMKVPKLGADLAALLSERDILRRPAGRADVCEPDITERLRAFASWHAGGEQRSDIDSFALRVVDRTIRQLCRLLRVSAEYADAAHDHNMIARLLLAAYPDRLAKKRDDGEGRFLLAQGRGVRLSAACSLGSSEYLVALVLDAGEKTEGTVHIACPLTEDIVRAECREQIETVRHVVWDKRSQRVEAAVEERIGAIVLTNKPFCSSDEEAIPLICGAIADNPDLLSYSAEAEQLRGRVALMRRHFPGESWPDFSSAACASASAEWIAPFLSGVRSADQLRRLNLATALKSRLSREQKRQLDERAPTLLQVPSGNRIAVDYVSGECPVLAVKLQEMFGCADTPTVAGGRIKVLLHLLSPARRTVQITQDLNTFWNSSYSDVRKELRGRYPKHPWPDDPWNALPTRRVKPRGA